MEKICSRVFVRSRQGVRRFMSEENNMLPQRSIAYTYRRKSYETGPPYARKLPMKHLEDHSIQYLSSEGALVALPQAGNFE
jgi:hypothetical protein